MLLPMAFYIRKFANKNEEFITEDGFLSLIVASIASVVVVGIITVIMILKEYRQIDCLPYAIMIIGGIFLCIQTYRAVKIKN